jgi:hypothetical protein
MNGKRPRSFATLVELARREKAPAIDVADRVLDSVQAGPRDRSSDWTLWTASLVSAAAAAAALVLAGYQGVLSRDPLAEFLCCFIPLIQ